MEGALGLELNHLTHSLVRPNSSCVTSDKCINLPEPVLFVSSHFKGWFYQAIENRLESCWHLIDNFKNNAGDFLGGPVAKTLNSLCRGLCLIPGQGTRSHMLQLTAGCNYNKRSYVLQLGPGAKKIILKKQPVYCVHDNFLISVSSHHYLLL